MKREVGIAELKAHLSEYVRAAQKGKEIVIKDRDTPVAKLTPIPKAKWLPKIIPATLSCRGTEDFESVTIPGLTPEEFERIWKETRRDWTDEWLDSNESTSTRRS
jgi:prevent-host-death family protein